MTDENKTKNVTEAEAGAEDIKDEALDQAEGGFALSGAFTAKLNTATFNPQFTNVNFNADENIIKADTKEDEAFLRTRPGRIGNPYGG